MATKAEELTFKDYFKYLWKKKIMTGIIAGSLLATSIIGLSIVSYETLSYSATVTLSWDGIDEEKYPDDSTFNYLDIVSLPNLQKAQYSDPTLNNINVEEMYSDDAISISNTIITNSNAAGEYSKYKYTIQIEKKYFDSKQQAQLFFTKLIEDNIYNVANKKIDSFNINNAFNFQDQNSQYDIVFNNIEAQIKLLEGYFELEESPINPNLVYNYEKNLKYSDLISNYNLFLKNNDYKVLRNTFINNGYVRNVDTYVDYYTEKRNDIINTIEMNTAYLNALQTQLSAINGSTVLSDEILEEIAEYAKANVDLNKEKEYIDNILSKPVSEVYNATFNQKVEQYQKQIEEFTNDLEMVYKTNSRNKTSLNYEKNSIITQEGLGTIMVIALSLIISITFTLLFIFFKLALMDQNKRAIILQKNIKNNEKDII